MPTPDDALLLELNELLIQRTIARYQDQIQDAYDRERDPHPHNFPKLKSDKISQCLESE